MIKNYSTMSDQPSTPIEGKAGGGGLMLKLGRFFDMLRRVKQVTRRTLTKMTDVLDTHQQLFRVRKDVAALNSELTEFRSEISTQLAFTLHDFGREFVGLANIKSQLDELARVQTEIQDLVTHVNTSVHSRLDIIENVKFFGLNEQLHEIAARVLAQNAFMTAGSHPGWVTQPEERYQPAERQTFDHWLGEANKLSPKIFPLWHERLVATQDAFRQTKVGNAAHAGDPRSRIFRSLVEINAIGRVLDVGCGVFGRPYYLSSYPKELISGIDPLEPMEAPDFEFVQGISEYLPWPDESFSTVISATSLDHCLSLEKSLAEMRRVLRPEGRLLLWIDSVPGSPSYQPSDDSFSPADKFHLFHFDVSWFEPELNRWWEVVDRLELTRTGFKQVMYCLTSKGDKQETLKAAQ